MQKDSKIFGTPVLLVCVYNRDNLVLTHDIYYRAFSRYGEKSKVWKAFIEMENTETALMALSKLDQTNLLSDGSQMNIFPSQMKQIKINNEHAGGIDYQELQIKETLDLNLKQQNLLIANTMSSSNTQSIEPYVRISFINIMPIQNPFFQKIMRSSDPAKRIRQSDQLENQLNSNEFGYNQMYRQNHDQMERVQSEAQRKKNVSNEEIIWESSTKLQGGNHANSFNYQSSDINETANTRNQAHSIDKTLGNNNFSQILNSQKLPQFSNKMEIMMSGIWNTSMTQSHMQNDELQNNSSQDILSLLKSNQRGNLMNSSNSSSSIIMYQSRNQSPQQNKIQMNDVIFEDMSESLVSPLVLIDNSLMRMKQMNKSAWVNEESSQIKEQEINASQQEEQEGDDILNQSSSSQGIEIDSKLVPAFENNKNQKKKFLFNQSQDTQIQNKKIEQSKDHANFNQDGSNSCKSIIKNDQSYFENTRKRPGFIITKKRDFLESEQFSQKCFQQEGRSRTPSPPDLKSRKSSNSVKSEYMHERSREIATMSSDEQTKNSLLAMNYSIFSKIENEKRQLQENYQIQPLTQPPELFIKSSSERAKEKKLVSSNLDGKSGENLRDVSHTFATDPSSYVNPVFLIENQKSPVLYVRNLNDQSIKCFHIYNLFSNFGNIKKIHLMQKKSAACIQYSDEQYSSEAKNFANNCSFMGNKLKIFYSNYRSLDEKLDIYPDDEVLQCDETLNRFQSQGTINRPSQVLHISNLKKEAANQGVIMDTFKSVGKIINLKFVVKDKIKHMCFIQFNTIDEAVDAMVNFHGKSILGRKIIISFTRTSLD